ncbi:MAG: phosphoribosylamine--glycine ligase, partial [archaeon]
MDYVVVGNGGREHALGWKLGQNPRNKVFCLPGNPGMMANTELEFIPVKPDNLELIELSLKYLSEEDPESAHKSLGSATLVVGPEGPLVSGIVDYFAERDIKVFGPTKAAAQLEGSKAFAKQFMIENHVPTADFCRIESAETAIKYVKLMKEPFVIKAD